MRVFLTVLTLSVAGCSGGGSSKAGSVAPIPIDWKPESVSIDCPSGDCPAGVGVMILVDDKSGNGNRCTASLVGRDIIVTNAHCDEQIGSYTRGYFIATDKNFRRTIVRQLSAKIFSEHGEMSGPDRDVAVYRLASAITEIPALEIARTIPAPMDRLNGFGIDEPGGSSFRYFYLNKKSCTTIPRMPLFNGGVEDNSIGIGLFGCNVIPGNSGGPLVLPGEGRIQGLMNTIWDLAGVEGKDIRGLFLETPNFMKRPYAMGERLHCLSLPGFAEPSVKCRRVSFEETLLKPMREAALASVERWFREDQGASAAEWAVQPMTVELTKSDIIARGLALVPYPICRYSERDSAVVSFDVVRLGLDGIGGARSVVVQKREFKADFVGEQMAVSVRDLGWVKDFYELKFEKQMIYDFATKSLQRRQIKECGANAREEALRRSLDSVNQIEELSPAEIDAPMPALIPRGGYY